MIPKAYITAWRQHAPWVDDSQVEQDLVLSRAIVEIFNHGTLRDDIAFRGGTVLHKLYMRPAARYSEDLDFVQVRPQAIGTTLDAIKTVLNPWLGEPKRAIGERIVCLTYRFMTDDQPPVRLRLKIEINSREQFSVYPLIRASYDVDNPWFSGATSFLTYELDELLGTKLRALHQRRKGRDLFDLDQALQRPDVDTARICACFARYIAQQQITIRRAEMERALANKVQHPGFRGDITPLLRTGVTYDIDAAYQRVLKKLIVPLPEVVGDGDVVDRYR